jgi:uncharacterized RDD family membrane protein YckC
MSEITIEQGSPRLSRRLAALVYDALLAVAILMLASAIALPLNGGKAIKPGTFWFELYLLLWLFAYFGYCWRNGATLGMSAWRLEISALDGSRITWLTAALRLPIALLGGAALGLGLWWCLLDHDRQSLADRICGTRFRLRK